MLLLPYMRTNPRKYSHKEIIRIWETEKVGYAGIAKVIGCSKSLVQVVIKRHLQDKKPS